MHVETGRPVPSILWVDLPSTHDQLLPDGNTVVESLRVETWERAAPPRRGTGSRRISLDKPRVVMRS